MSRAGRDVEKPGVAPALQDGIYFRPGQRPGSCYRLVLLNIKSNTTRGDAKAAIAAVWAMLEDLRRGIVGELRRTRPSDPDIHVPDGRLTCLLGFGAPLFERFPMMGRPQELQRLGDLPFPSLRWVAAADRRTGEADLALQLIAETDLAVDRAVVEVGMLIRANPLPLEIVTFHDGSNRDDRRSWLGFYDGISNIDPSQRATALEVVLNDPPWMTSGTYMGFLRLEIDLETWRGLSREDQETIVGRDKLTGCPLESVAPGPIPAPIKGCPVGGNRPGSPTYINPPPPEQDLLRRSHMHRSNPNRDGAGNDANNRIFRQGFEFVEPLEGRLRLGLNFVSFQRSLTRLINILVVPGWLGNANFGGYTDAQPGEPPYVSLVSVIAGGYYAVPPKAEPFPGAEIF